MLPESVLKYNGGQWPSSSLIERTSRHYEKTNTKKGAAHVAKLLAKKKKPEKQSEKQSRRNYSQDEKLAIDDFFKTQIENDRHVSLEQCRDFLRLHPTIDRRPKQIQDRVKTLR